MPILQPIIKWAQRKNVIYLNLGIRDIEDEKVNLTETKLDFHCKTNKGEEYQFSYEFYEEIDAGASKWSKTGFHMVLILTKKNQGKPYWPRLTKLNVKSQYIQCDWEKWVDEDEEAEEGSKGLEGLDPSAMQNFNDSDDEDEPKEGNIDDLDKEEAL